MVKTSKKFKLRKYSSVGFLNPSDVQIYGEELERIREKYGKLTPDIVVQEASSRKSPIHKYFEWDDDTASQKWRLQQARILVNHITVIVKTPRGNKNFKAFYSVDTGTENKFEDRAYVSVEEVISDKKYREQIVKEAIQEALYWKEKFVEYRELGEIFKAIDRTKKKMKIKIVA